MTQHFQYTTDDQAFFFEMSCQILDRFKLLDGIPERYLDDYVINFGNDIVRLLDQLICEKTTQIKN